MKLSKILEKKENYATSKSDTIDKPMSSASLSQNQQAKPHVDSSTYSRKTGSVLATDLKSVNHSEMSFLSHQNQNVSKTHTKNSLYFSSSDSVSYTGELNISIFLNISNFK